MSGASVTPTPSEVAARAKQLVNGYEEMLPLLNDDDLEAATAQAANTVRDLLAALEEAHQENARLKQQNNFIQQHLGHLLSDAQEREERLREAGKALTPHVLHSGGCSGTRQGEDGLGTCSCGASDAIREWRNVAYSRAALSAEGSAPTPAAHHHNVANGGNLAPTDPVATEARTEEAKK